MGFLGRFLRSVWHGLDVVRRGLHLLLMLLVFALIAGALRQSIPRLPDRGALIISPTGDIVEQLAGEPIQRAINEAQGQEPPQTLLWDLTEAIGAAAKDDRVGALLIDTDRLGSAGQAKLEELAAAIAGFRATGKKVVARGSSFTQTQYYLAAQADEVYLDPFGYVLLEGYGRYRTYYKDAIDRLGIDVHLYRAGRFKSAMEPYIRRDMSPEDREESETYLRALWSGYRNAIARARRMGANDVSTYADRLAESVRARDGNAALVARDAGLVTGVRTSAEVDRRMIELVGATPERSGGVPFRSMELPDYLRVVRTEQSLRRRTGPTVGVVVASGEIEQGEQPPGTIGGTTASSLLRQARENPDVRAVVLRIDSPGGDVFASEEIYREVLALKAAGKPVIASMSDLAASGGYYIAAPANRIFASANTITGSIGVFGVVPTFSRTLDKIGVTVDGTGTSPLSGALRLDRPLAPAADSLLQSLVAHTYQEFLARVAVGRAKSPADIDAIGQGRVWAGSDAQRLGLVDELGGYQAAVNAAARAAHLGANYHTERIEPALTWAQQFLFRMRDATAGMARALGLGNLPGAEWRAALGPLDREVSRLMRFATDRRPLAYCFCAAP